jgi:hypothetical protein
MVFGFAVLAAGLISYGAVRQTLSFSECGAGKPEMSLTAFAVAGFGGTACATPRSRPTADADAESDVTTSARSRLQDDDVLARIGPPIKACAGARHLSPKVHYDECRAARPLIEQQINFSTRESDKDGFRVVSAAIENDEADGAYELGRKAESERLEADSLSTLKMVMATTGDAKVKQAATAAYRCYTRGDCGSLRQIDRASGQ